MLISSHIRLGFPSGLFPSGFPTKTLIYTYIFDHIYTEFRLGAVLSIASQLHNSGRMRLSVLEQASFSQFYSYSFFKFPSAPYCDAGKEGSLTPDEERVLLFVFLHESLFVC